MTTVYPLFEDKRNPWQCPACKIWYAPHVASCDCAVKILDEPRLPDTSWTNEDAAATQRKLKSWGVF